MNDWRCEVELRNRGKVTAVFSYFFQAFPNARLFLVASCDWSATCVQSVCISQLNHSNSDSIITKSDPVTILIDKNIMKSEAGVTGTCSTIKDSARWLSHLADWES